MSFCWLKLVMVRVFGKQKETIFDCGALGL